MKIEVKKKKKRRNGQTLPFVHLTPSYTTPLSTMPYSIKHLSNQFSYFIYFGWYFLVLAKLVFLSLLSPLVSLVEQEIPDEEKRWTGNKEYLFVHAYSHRYILSTTSIYFFRFSNAVPPDYVNIVWNIFFLLLSWCVINSCTLRSLYPLVLCTQPMGGRYTCIHL